MASTQPLLILVMGVSGCGKSTVAAEISQAFGFEMVEADDFHSDTSKEMMANGIPLTDDIRLVWIKRLCDRLRELYHDTGKHVAMACSGLKREHRMQFHALPYQTHTLFLSGSSSVLQQRLTSRKDHFFKPSLLSSQLEALEPPQLDENRHIIDIAAPIAQVTAQTTSIVNTLLAGSSHD